MRPSTRSSTPASRNARSTRGRNSRAPRRRGRAASRRRCTRPGRCVLALSTIASAIVEVGGRVDEDVAVARRRVDHRHRRDLAQRRLQALAAARDDQVDQALLPGQLGQRVAPALDELDRALGRVLGGDRRQHRVGVRRARRAAQHDRVARLQAQRGRVDRDVRPRLVDDGDDAERHALLAHVEPVGQPEALDHLADRVAQRGDVAHLRGDRADARLVEHQPVEQRGATGRPRARPPCRARWPRRSRRPRASSASAIACSAASLARRVERRQAPRRGARGDADVGDGVGGDGHAGRVRARPPPMAPGLSGGG